MVKVILVSLVVVGAILFYTDDLLQLITRLPLSHLRELATKWASRWEHLRKRSLKQRIEQIDSPAKINIIMQSYRTMATILSATGSGDRLQTMRLLSVSCGVVGAGFAVHIRSYMLVPILGIGLALVPMWMTKFKAYHYNVRVMDELSVALSMVTNSYLRCDNIVVAVRENISYMRENIKPHFEWFITMCTSVNPDIGANLVGLKGKIDNPVFRLWCDNLVICQRDSNQKHSLNAVVEQFSTEHELLNLLSAEITKPVKVYSAVAALSMLAFPLATLFEQRLATSGSANVLFGTFGGQLLVVVYAVTLLFGVNKAIDISTQI